MLSRNEEDGGSESGDEEDDTEIATTSTNQQSEENGLRSMSTLVMTGDPANVLSITKERPLTDQERMYVLDNSFDPHPQYMFPGRLISGSVRHSVRRVLG